MCCLQSIYTIDTIYAVYGKLCQSSPKSSETSSFFKPHTFDVSVHEAETYMDNVRLSETEKKQAAAEKNDRSAPRMTSLKSPKTVSDDGEGENLTVFGYIYIP